MLKLILKLPMYLSYHIFVFSFLLILPRFFLCQNIFFVFTLGLIPHLAIAGRYSQSKWLQIFQSLDTLLVSIVRDLAFFFKLYYFLQAQKGIKI